MLHLFSSFIFDQFFFFTKSPEPLPAMSANVRVELKIRKNHEKDYSSYLNTDSPQIKMHIFVVVLVEYK